MSDLLDIMVRLTAHIGSTLSHPKGVSVVKGEAYYRDHLMGLSDDAKARLIAHCEQHGCYAELDPGAMGGLALTLRRI